MQLGHPLRVRQYKVLWTGPHCTAPHTMFNLWVNNAHAGCYGGEFNGKVLLVGGEVAQIVSKDHFLSGLTHDEKVILLQLG